MSVHVVNDDLRHIVPVCLCNLSALVAISTDHHYGLVLVLVHIGERRVTLYKHARIHLDIQLAAQVGHALRLMLSATIGKENERYSLRLEVRECLCGSR